MVFSVCIIVLRKNQVAASRRGLINCAVCWQVYKNVPIVLSDESEKWIDHFVENWILHRMICHSAWRTACNNAFRSVHIEKKIIKTLISEASRYVDKPHTLNWIRLFLVPKVCNRENTLHLDIQTWTKKYIVFKWKKNKRKTCVYVCVRVFSGDIYL